MIVDERTYTLTVGGVPEFYEIYAEHGLEVQTRILGNLLGFFHTEIGELNRIVHLWGYDSMAERTRRRTELWQDADWLAYVEMARPLMVKMENRILVPAPFSPIK
jgi:hypothetical protein